jgi:hypothetical protein
MHRQRVLWPIVAHPLVTLALVAGCSGQSPLQVKTTNPLEDDERDVLVAGRGCDVGCAAQGGSRVIVESGGSGAARPVAGYGGTAGYGPVPGWGGSAGAPFQPPISPPHNIICGDGRAEPPEICDGTDLAGRTCAMLGYAAGGLLACSPSTCTFDVSQCRSQSNVGIPWVPVDAGFDDDAGIQLPGL